MDRDHDPDNPVFVTMPDEGAQVGKVARPGVVVWLGERVPDEDEIEAARDAAMRRHPANTSSPSRHLRAVS